jgi:hypothetical protein
MTEPKEKRKFDKALLEECMKRDGATLIGEYEKITATCIILFICKCSITNKKTFKNIVNFGGAFCKTCYKISRKTKTVKTCLERYGVESISQVEDFKQARKSTNIEKYGVEYPTQNKEIQKKTKKTIIQKYGVNNLMLSNEVKNKIKATNLDKYGVENVSQNTNIKEKKKITTKKNYGVEHPGQSLIIKEKIKNTNLEIYGVVNPFQNDDIKEKIKKINLEKYGTVNPSQTDDIKEKIKKTNLEKYGAEFTLQVKEIREKGKKTSLEKYGVEHCMQNKDIRQKAIDTCIEKYGVENPTQNLEIFEKAEKNAKKFKEYKMPSGTIRKVQGYEPFALDTLLKTYTEEQIKTDRKEVPRVSYEVDGKKKYYFPDIFIPHENKLIEVKSCWTIKIEPEKIKAKEDACKEQGYEFEIWCYNGKGVRVSV